MAKTMITITLDHHPATPTLRRLLELLDWYRNCYGVRSLDVEHDFTWSDR